MGGFIERLREAQRIEREKREAQERLAREQRNTEHRIHREAQAQIQADIELAEGFFKESDFPRLLEELQPVVPSMSLYTGPQAIHGSPGYLYLYRKLQLPLGERSSYTLATWLEDGEEIIPPKDWFDRLFRYSEVAKYNFKAFIIEANPQGEIVVHCKNTHVLSPSQWRGNHGAQENSLEIAYTNPLTYFYGYPEWEGYSPVHEGDQPGPG